MFSLRSILCEESALKQVKADQSLAAVAVQTNQTGGLTGGA